MPRLFPLLVLLFHLRCFSSIDIFPICQRFLSIARIINIATHLIASVSFSIGSLVCIPHLWLLLHDCCEQSCRPAKPSCTMNYPVSSVYGISYEIFTWFENMTYCALKNNSLRNFSSCIVRQRRSYALPNRKQPDENDDDDDDFVLLSQLCLLPL